MIRVSAGIIRRGELILAAQRGEGRKNAHLWEFPGGKQEPGEDAAACLIRELREELGLQTGDVRPLFENEAQGIRFTFLTGRALNEPVATEHEALLFLPAHRLLQLQWCPADVEAARMLWLGGFRHFLWDFDGTLMDTYPMITDCVQRACLEHGIHEPAEALLSLLKVELPHCLRVLEQRHGVAADALMADYQRHALEADLSQARPVAGVPELLRSLRERGCRHYIVTHRSRASCLEMLDRHGLTPLFDDMITREDPLPRKPAPDRCAAILDRHGIRRDQAVMVGDRPLDILSGRDAGISTLLLDSEGRFPDCPADLTIPDFRQLRLPPQ